MLRIFRLFLVLSFAAQAWADPLDSLAGRAPAILIFAKSRSDARVDRQLALLQERRAELEGRGAVAIVVLGDREAIAAIGYASLPAGAGVELRRIHAPSPRGMTVVLVARDGATVARWETVVAPDALFDALDALPGARSDVGTVRGAG